jgi:hypothetical protein
MGISQRSFTKELLFKVRNDLVLVLTRGDAEVNIEELAKLFEASPSECTLATSQNITNIGWTKYSIPGTVVDVIV